MEIQADFKELLGFLNARKVEYLIVGGYALAFHGVPRFTGDLDLYVKPDPANAERIVAALRDFGFESVGLYEKDFTEEDQVVLLGQLPVQIDLMTSLTGVSWDEAYAGRVQGKYGDVTVYFLGRKQLAANKRAQGHFKDLADLEALGETI
jgi:hypothetical protein